jgi:hypothetical protein
LSDMGWQQKYTAFCNLTTHSVDKLWNPWPWKRAVALSIRVVLYVVNYIF